MIINKPLTVKQLYQECRKEINNGNGDKVIMISDDDEGNGYHYLWYAFTNEVGEMLEYLPMDVDDRIAKEEDTIILG